MPVEMLNTKEVAEYLGIHEKQVYALIKGGRIPCTRVTGKWVFPKNLIDEWINENARVSAAQTERPRRAPGQVMASGSNDPVLDLLLSRNEAADFHIFTCNTGSTEGLRLMGESRTDIAWCHLLDPETGEYNIPYIAARLADKKIAVVHLFYREIGFVLSAAASKKIKQFADLPGSGLRFLNRQEGSGIRIFLDHHLRKAGIDAASIDGYGASVRTHFEIGLSILNGSADAGIASVAIARLLGLPFVPLARESFDMVLGRETFFERGIQTFMEILKSDAFKSSVRPLGDYDFSDSGKILYTTA